MSPIEQSIKNKIESVGTPLRDWDINIYRGILTGYNEAFIISGKKRNEILQNCATKEEKQRTAEIIRPILRGSTIEQYKINWNGEYIINFHNGYVDSKGNFIKAVNPKDVPAIVCHIDKIVAEVEKGI